MAKSTRKAASKASSRSKSGSRKRPGKPRTDPPIIIKSGAVVQGPATLMDMECKDPMDFSWVESDDRPYEYYYPLEVGEVITTISLTVDGDTITKNVGGKVWGIEFTIGISRR